MSSSYDTAAACRGNMSQQQSPSAAAAAPGGSSSTGASAAAASATTVHFAALDYEDQQDLMDFRDELDGTGMIEDGPATNMLRDLAILAEQYQPDDTTTLLMGGDSAPSPAARNNKRRRSSDQEQLDNRKRPAITVDSKTQMDQAMSRRDAAYNKVESIRIELEKQQRLYKQAQDQLEQAQQYVSQVGHQVFKDLLREDNNWNRTFQQLRHYHAQHGHSSVPRNSPKAEHAATIKLGNWVGKQRRDYRRPLGDPKRLKDYQIIALESLNFDWNPKQTTWMKKYHDLAEYSKQHGHANVPFTVKADKNDPNASLGYWISRQRYQYKLFKEGNPKSEMSQDRIELLEKVGFVWNRREDTWMKSFQELQSYKQVHGNTHCVHAPKSLADWTKEQRTQLKRYEQQDPKKSNLTEHQVKLLRELPLDVCTRGEISWNVRLDELLEFKKRHGHCIIPNKYPLNPKLGNWVATQRRQYQLMMEGKPSQMTPDRAKLLTDAGFEWKVSAVRKAETKTWDEYYLELCKRLEKTGSLDAGSNHALRVWTAIQQDQYYKKVLGQSSDLTVLQASKLKELGF